ncbi:hypothetical protein AJ87_48705 [Rhizobium yanglingense]|nr:hypothetical protein AJ87_48705 [Rhizobium yanglingense]
MKLFTLPFRRRQNNPGNEVIPTSPQPTFYTFDFDPASERFFALFCHGTSSENLQQILREGLRRPQLDRILDEVLRERPDLLLRREFLESIAAQAILSMKRREEEAGIFATWLANPSALWRMTQDIPSIVRHGGEVYAVAWRAISDELRRGQEEELLPRFADASSSAIFFRAPFYHGMVEEGTFSTNAGQLLYYARI